MATYVLTDEGKKQIKSNMLRVIPLIAIADIFVLIILYMIMPSQLEIIFLFIALLLLLTSSIILFVVGQITIKSSESMSYTLDNDRLVCTKLNSPQKVIDRADIGRIIDIEGKGIRIESTDRSSIIFVPTGLQNYQEFKSAISGWTPSTQQENRFKYLFIYIVIGSILVVTAILTESKPFEFLVIAFILVFSTFMFVRNMKKIWSKKST
jgi:hypothetical protein